MRTAGAEKQGWGFGRNEATVRAAARRGPEDAPQGDEAGFEFVPGQIFRWRDFQETGMGLLCDLRKMERATGIHCASGSVRLWG